MFLGKVPQSPRRCKHLICGKACGNIKTWAVASPDECDDYCVACQAIQMVTPEDETADIAAMTKRGPLYNQKLKPRVLREYTDFISHVEREYTSFELNGQYSKWPLEDLKLAYPDTREQLTPVKAATMFHHLLLLQHMYPSSTKASRDAQKCLSKSQT